MSDYPFATIRIELGPGKRLGPGKVRLLELIDTTGSISAAAREMKMSYRRAWLLIEDLNGVFGKPVVEAVAGGAGGGGTKVTLHGKSIFSAFRAIEAESERLIAAKLREFPSLDRQTLAEPSKIGE